MTRSDIDSAKEPFPANDNFQELKSDFPGNADCDFRPFCRDSSVVAETERHLPEAQRSFMVSGISIIGGVEHCPEDVQALSGSAPRNQFANWTAKNKIGRRKVTRSLTLPQVTDLQSGWHYASKIDQPMNRFITVRPHDINDQDPEQRIQTWTSWRNKLAQFARDHQFDFTCLWTRESERNTGLNEHMHVLMHVPRELQRRFDKVVEGWCDGTDEIDVRRCSYQTRINRKGGQSNIMTYVSKNSPQAGRFFQRIIQLGGPILGKRYGLSRNVTARARSRDEVRGGLRRDLGLVIVTATATIAAPMPRAANDHAQGPNRRYAA